MLPMLYIKSNYAQNMDFSSRRRNNIRIESFWSRRAKSLPKYPCELFTGSIYMYKVEILSFRNFALQLKEFKTKKLLFDYCEYDYKDDECAIYNLFPLDQKLSERSLQLTSFKNLLKSYAFIKDRINNRNETII